MLPAFQSKGIPRLLRADAGSENIAVGKFMYIVRGEDSFIVGRSVNNQRIERFWRDLRVQVFQPFISFFSDLGNRDLYYRQPEGIWIIQYLFLPMIQEKVAAYKDAWNNHPMRTANSLTPFQQNIRGERNYYIPYDANNDEIRRAITPLQQEYEGKISSRSVCPFQTQEAKQLFEVHIQPITAHEQQGTWMNRLMDAFQEAFRLQQWELQL